MKDVKSIIQEWAEMLEISQHCYDVDINEFNQCIKHAYDVFFRERKESYNIDELILFGLLFAFSTLNCEITIDEFDEDYRDTFEIEMNFKACVNVVKDFANAVINDEHIEIKSDKMIIPHMLFNGTIIDFTYDFKTGEKTDYIKEVDAFYYTLMKRKKMNIPKDTIEN